MQKRNIKMGLIAILASAILAGALACGSGNDSDPTATELKRIEQMAIENLVSQEVLDARVARVEDTNTALSDRITELESGGPATASASATPPRTDLGPGYNNATPEDRQLVREFLECAMKATGTDAALIPTLIDVSEKETWDQVDAGGMTLDEIKMLHSFTCAN
jgi:hypothetical protein